VDLQLEVSEDQALVGHHLDSEDTLEVHKLLLSKNIFTSMFHHQIKRKSDNNVQFQLLLPKNTIKLYSSRLHHLHHTKHQSFQSNHKMKKRLSSTF
jgi:hypothetical protein